MFPPPPSPSSVIHPTHNFRILPRFLLAQFRIAATPEEFLALASGYRAEIERMQKEVLEYLTKHASSSIQAKAV